MTLTGVMMLCSILLGGAALAVGQLLLGAPQEVSENDAGVQRALQYAMNQYNQASNDMYGSRVDEVIKAQKQHLVILSLNYQHNTNNIYSKLVSGIKYILDVKVGRTSCPKSTMNVEGCAFLEAAEKVTCHFEVHSIPWLNQIRLVKNNCQQ